MDFTFQCNFLEVFLIILIKETCDLVSLTNCRMTLHRFVCSCFMDGEAELLGDSGPFENFKTDLIRAGVVSC